MRRPQPWRRAWRWPPRCCTYNKTRDTKKHWLAATSWDIPFWVPGAASASFCSVYDGTLATSKKDTATKKITWGTGPTTKTAAAWTLATEGLPPTCLRKRLWADMPSCCHHTGRWTSKFSKKLCRQPSKACASVFRTVYKAYVQPHAATATCKTLWPFFLSCQVHSCVGYCRHPEGHTCASVFCQRWLRDTSVAVCDCATMKQKGRTCAKRFCTRLVCDTSLLKQLCQTVCSSAGRAVPSLPRNRRSTVLGRPASRSVCLPRRNFVTSKLLCSKLKALPSFQYDMGSHGLTN